HYLDRRRQMKVILRTGRTLLSSEQCGLGRPGSNLLVPALEQRGAFFPYVASIGVHVAFVSVMVATAGLFPPPAQAPQPKPRWKLTILRLQNQVFLPVTPATARSERKDLAERLRKRASQLASQMRADNSDPRPPRNAFPLPAETPPNLKPSQAILIQPQFPIDLQPPPAAPVVPSALVWTKQAPKPAQQKVVQPGPVQRELPVPEPPVLTEEARSGARILETPDALPSTDLRTARPADKQTVSKSSNTQAVQLLSLSNAPAVSDTVVVPPGNLIPAAGTTAGSGGRGQTEGTRSAAPQATAAPTGSDSVHPPAAAGNSDTPKTTAGAEIPSSTPVNTPAPPTPPPAVASLIPVERSIAPAAPPRGLEHPTNGRFDIVVMQTSMDESLPPGLLTGKPVYTVYLQVGDSKEWTMHYCAAETAAIQRGAVVQLPDPRPLNAPYPRLTFRPGEPITGSGPYVLIRGIVDETGSLQNLQVIGTIASGRASLLDALSKWKFRPATRAGTPARVEMVLSIPVSKT
ncbi:MAG TPA: hypothetical protein VMZ52_16255, partial [Bryobacteraceae bacterium]|nr:hypothetical protein [Bryobacteraceae bacterium]